VIERLFVHIELPESDIHRRIHVFLWTGALRSQVLLVLVPVNAYSETCPGGLPRSESLAPFTSFICAMTGGTQRPKQIANRTGAGRPRAHRAARASGIMTASFNGVRAAATATFGTSRGTSGLLNHQMTRDGQPALAGCAGYCHGENQF
jgi:hypothetical protein